MPDFFVQLLYFFFSVFAVLLILIFSSMYGVFACSVFSVVARQLHKFFLNFVFFVCDFSRIFCSCTARIFGIFFMYSAYFLVD